MPSGFLDNVLPQPYIVSVNYPIEKACENNMHSFMLCAD
jgi:hypothetical protein